MEPAALADTATTYPVLWDRSGRHARRFGLFPATTSDLEMVVYELAANSIVHGGCAGTLRIWVEPDPS